MGVSQAMTLRYIPFGSLLWFFVILSLAEPAKRPGGSHFIAMLAILAIVGGSLATAARGIYYAATRHDRLEPVPAMLAEGRTREAAERLLVPAEELEDRLPLYLEIIGR